MYPFDDVLIRSEVRVSSLESPPVVMVECSLDVACFFEQLLTEFAPDMTWC